MFRPLKYLEVSKNPPYSTISTNPIVPLSEPPTTLAVRIENLVKTGANRKTPSRYAYKRPPEPGPVFAVIVAWIKAVIGSHRFYSDRHERGQSWSRSWFHDWIHEEMLCATRSKARFCCLTSSRWISDGDALALFARKRIDEKSSHRNDELGP